MSAPRPLLRSTSSSSFFACFCKSRALRSSTASSGVDVVWGLDSCHPATQPFAKLERCQEQKTYQARPPRNKQSSAPIGPSSENPHWCPGRFSVRDIAKAAATLCAPMLSCILSQQSAMVRQIQQSGERHQQSPNDHSSDQPQLFAKIGQESPSDKPRQKPLLVAAKNKRPRRAKETPTTRYMRPAARSNCAPGRMGGFLR